MMDLLTVSSVLGNVLEVIVIVILVRWLAFDKKQAKKRPRRQKKEPTVVVQTVIPKETE